MNYGIKTVPPSGLSNDELIVASAFLGLLVDRIREQGNDVPADVAADQRAVDTELADRQRGDKERRLQLAYNRRDQLLTVPERRERNEAEIAELEAELGVGTQKAAPTTRSSSKKGRGSRK